MYKYNDSDIERILKRLSEEKPEEMENIDEIDESVFMRIESKVLSKLSKSKKTKKMKTRIYLRAAAAAVGIVALFSVAFYLIEMPSIRASKDVKSVNESQQVPFNEDGQNVGMPEYIPEGYVLEEGYEGTEPSLAEYKYANPADESLYILISIDGGPVRVPEEGRKIQELEFNGLPFIFITVPGSPDISYANFFDAQGHNVQIAATLDYDTIMEIMVNIK